MNELIWRPEYEQKADLVKQESRDRDKWGNDGHIQAATGVFEYKGIKYEINVLRYYILNSHGRLTGFCPMGSRKSEYFANLEYPDETKPIVEVVKLIREYSSSFLYNDSLHSYSDEMDVEQQIEKMHQIAREDIDSLMKLDEEIDAKIKALEEVKQRVRESVINGGYI